MGSAIEYSVVVPVYNSATILHELRQRLTAVFEQVLQAPHEIIFVDDGSRDNSWSVLQQLYQSDKRVRAVQLSRNSGQHFATLAGIARAKGKVIITIDDDLQNPPEEIPKLIGRLRDGSGMDAVMAMPIKRHDSWFRLTGSQLHRWLIAKVMNLPQQIYLSSFIAFNDRLKTALLDQHLRGMTTATMIAMTTDRIANVPVEYHARSQGRSNYTVSRLVNMSLNYLVNFSYFPLRAIAFIGLFSALLAAVYGLVTLYQKLTGYITVPGFTTIALLITFFSGLLLVSFGVLGEYLIRILQNLNENQPNERFDLRHYE